MTGNLEYTVSMSYASLRLIADEIFSHADAHQEPALHGAAFLLETVADSLERALKTSEVQDGR